jgi:hypothetical protein
MAAGERMEYVGDGYNDRISSVRIYGRARVTLCHDSNFRGSERRVTSDAPGLGGFNDRSSSIEVRWPQARRARSYCPARLAA